MGDASFIYVHSELTLAKFKEQVHSKMSDGKGVKVVCVPSDLPNSMEIQEYMREKGQDFEYYPAYASTDVNAKPFVDYNTYFAAKEKFDAIQKGVNSDWHPFTKAIYLYLQVCKNVSYEIDCMLENLEQDTEWCLKQDAEARNIFSSITSSKGICEGTSVMHLYSCHRNRIKCYVDGHGGHAWNCIDIDETTISMDTTADLFNAKFGLPLKGICVFEGTRYSKELAKLIAKSLEEIGYSAREYINTSIHRANPLDKNIELLIQHIKNNAIKPDLPEFLEALRYCFSERNNSISANIAPKCYPMLCYEYSNQQREKVLILKDRGSNVFFLVTKCSSDFKVDSLSNEEMRQRMNSLTPYNAPTSRDNLPELFIENKQKIWSIAR